MAGDAHHGLIGRAAESEAAARLLREAAAGRPRLLVLRGPAGVGKSTLARAVQAEAVALGARTLWGAGQEDLAIPYLPMAMALEGLRDERHPDPVVLDGDPGRTWSDVGARVLDACRVQPLVVVVDDLQWTDPSTQALLLHLQVLLEHAARSQPVRCCTIVTVRTPVDDERTARTLDRLVREPGVDELDLAGLDRVAVADLVAAVAPSRPSALVVERVVEATDGNPLLVQTLVRRGLAEGRLYQRDGALQLRDRTDHLSLDPSELDRGVAARLGALDEPAVRLLTVAAFLGDDQPVNDLVAIAGIDPDEADLVLERAVAAGLLVDRGSRVAFAHPQVRHVLFHRPARRRRQRLHLEIAEAIEARKGERGALSIAHHLVRAGDLVEGDQVVRWCTRAAEDARSLGAWADAGIAGEHALEALPHDAPWEQRADLHLLVTRMASFDYDLAAVQRHAAAAIALAEEHGDPDRWGEALLPLARAVVTNTRPEVPAPDPSPMLRRFLEANPAAPAGLRAQMLSLLSEIAGAAGDVDGALAAAAAARGALDDGVGPQVAALALVAEGMARLARLDLREAIDAYDRTVALVGIDPNERPGMYAGVRVNLVRHLAGDLDRAARDGAVVERLLGAAQVWGEHGLAAAIGAGTALGQARFDDVERLAEEAVRSARRAGFGDPRVIGLPAVALGRALRGDGRGAVEAIDLALGRSGAAVRHRLAVDALLGDLGRVRTAVRERPWRAPAHDVTLQSLAGLVLHAEVASAIGDPAMADDAVGPLRDLHQRGVVVSHGWVALVSRCLADCHLARGDLDEARAWLATAATEARSIPLEAARVELSAARLAVADPSTTTEVRAERVGRAVAALDRIGALALVATARRLDTWSSTLEGPATRSILFTDLVDSTALNVRAGDRAFLELLREHNDVARSCLRRSSGVEFKHTGDGIAAWFTAPADAVECAMAMTEELDRASLLHPDLPFHVRCGIAAGEPLGNEGDLFGLSVVRAARLCAAAGPGEVLVGPEVVDLVRAHGVVLQRRGAMELKGFPDPVEVHAAVRTARAAAR